MNATLVKTNKYAAHCTICRRKVEPEQGSIEKVDGKWITTCLDAESCVAATPKSVQAALVSVSLTDVPEGVYSVEGRLYQFDHPQGGEWAGWTFVKLIEMKLQGTTATGKPKVKKTKLGKAASAKPGFGAKFFGTQAASDIAAIVEDPLAAAQMVGKTTSICGVCSAALEDPISVERGIGPVCWKKWGLG